MTPARPTPQALPRRAHFIQHVPLIIYCLIALLLTACAAPQPAPTLTAADTRTAAAFNDLTHQLADPDMRGRGLGTPELDRARDLITHHFTAAGLTPGCITDDATRSYLQPFRSHRGPAYNVIGYLPGSGDLADQFILLIAHYDHLGSEPGPDGSTRIYHGADDNASGTAALLLTANALANHYRTTGPAPSPRRSIAFIAFTGEESGLRGSGYFAAHPDETVIDLNNIHAVINLDMVGRLNHALILHGIDTAPFWKPLAKQAARDLPLQLDLRDMGAMQWRGDHTSFDRLQIPTLLVFTGLHDDYHQPTDTPDRLNPQGSALIIHWLINLLPTLAEQIIW